MCVCVCVCVCDICMGVHICEAEVALDFFVVRHFNFLTGSYKSRQSIFTGHFNFLNDNDMFNSN